MKTVLFCRHTLARRLLAMATASLGTLGFLTAEEAPRLHATIELKDGSRIVGKPGLESLEIISSFGAIEVDLARVKELGCTAVEGKAKLLFGDGDRVTGTLPAKPFPIESCLGRLQIPWAEVDVMRFSLKGGRLMPAGKGALTLGGINWTPMRVAAEVQDQRLITLPKATKGFQYGHSGHGRSATLVSNVGNPDWRDYRLEFDAAVTGIDPKFNPHGIRSNQVGFSTYFHVADIKESWNEKGHSAYALAINPEGEWSLTCVYNQHCPGARGYQSSVRDGMRKLAKGQVKRWELNQAKRIAIEVVGDRIQIWVDGELLVDLHDEEMDTEIGGITLDHGGIGFRWGWEGMGWIENLSVEGR